MKKTLKFTNGDSLEIGTLFGVASNYSKHATEMGTVVPSEPAIFIKPPASYIEGNEEVIIPEISNNVHHEVELVVVIGKECKNINRNEASEYIAGFGIGIDFTLRDIQAKAKNEGKPWAISKGFYTSAPISEIIPYSEINNPNPEISLLLSINGNVVQNGNTSDMERKPDLLIEYLSRIFTLNPGDCIFTGTPDGVGPVVSGDKVRCELGDLINLEVKVR